MIKKKPSDPFWMVLSHDPALIPAGPATMQKYLLDRDIDHFDIDMEKGICRSTGELVTLIKAYPLKSDSFALVESGALAFPLIVRTHVIKVLNLEGVSVKTNKDGATEITDSDMANMDLETLQEIASVIIEKGRGRDGIERGFFSVDISSLQRSLSRRLPANRARVESASETIPVSSETEKTKQ